MITVVIVDSAEAQLREINEWWRQHRPAAPTLVLDELAGWIRLLQSSPELGVRFHRTPVPGVRRLVMKKTRHLIYYIHDVEHSIVYIIAIWGAPKEGDPVLHDPRT